MKVTNVAPKLGVIELPTLKEVVAENIRAAIMRGELTPGQRLTESGLAKQLGVGQATIREAFIELEHLGYIEKPRRRETFVTSLTRKDIDAIYAVRLPLERCAIRLLSALPDRDITEAERACAQMLAAAESNDQPRFEESDLQFHRALWAATGNSYLIEFLERLVGKLFAFALVTIRAYHPSREKVLSIAGHHADILHRLQNDDVEGAEEALEASMDRTWFEERHLESAPSLS